MKNLKTILYIFVSFKNLLDNAAMLQCHVVYMQADHNIYCNLFVEKILILHFYSYSLSVMYFVFIFLNKESVIGITLKKISNYQ